MSWFQEHITSFAFTMEQVYSISGISRQGHSQSRLRAEVKFTRKTRVLNAVIQARLSHPRMGSRALHKMLHIEDMGVNQFERLLSAEGLGIKRRRNQCKTTDGHTFKGKCNNKVNGKELDGVNQLWVSDITYFLTGEKVFYIVMIMDVYSRKILGAEISSDMFAEHNLSVLKASLKQRGISNYNGQLIHHSDKGSQYMSAAYKRMLMRHGIELSVAENSLQNAYAERINGIVKNDYLRFFHTDNLTQLRKHLTRSIWLYNHQRPHSSLNYMTPVAYEASLEKGKSEKMTLYDFNKVVVEFFSGMSNQNGCPLKEKQAPSKEPAIPVGQQYSLNGCSPAEPLSASRCQCKNNSNLNFNIKKL
ncbi:hypothetical protein FACS189464_4250 [Bacteroidia bacterium]|nr:hypothetical protein FACS189464_4250 [Bacteroidia bacterium]